MKSISSRLAMLIATLGVAVPCAYAGVAAQTSTVAVQATAQSPVEQLLAKRGGDDAPGDDRGGGGGDDTGCDDHGTDVCRTAA